MYYISVTENCLKSTLPTTLKLTTSKKNIFFGWNKNPLFYPLLGTSIVAILSSLFLIICYIANHNREYKSQADDATVSVVQSSNGQTIETVSPVMVIESSPQTTIANTYGIAEYSAYAPISLSAPSHVAATYDYELEGIYDRIDSISPTYESVDFAAGRAATNMSFTPSSIFTSVASPHWTSTGTIGTILPRTLLTASTPVGSAADGKVSESDYSLTSFT